MASSYLSEAPLTPHQQRLIVLMKDPFQFVYDSMHETKRPHAQRIAFLKEHLPKVGIEAAHCMYDHKGEGVTEEDMRMILEEFTDSTLNVTGFRVDYPSLRATLMESFTKECEHLRQPEIIGKIEADTHGAVEETMRGRVA